MDKYTADNTVIAAAWNLCVHERAHGREPVFNPLLVGRYSTFRQQRLFESALTMAITHRQPHQAEVHAAATRNVERFRFENYGEV